MLTRFRLFWTAEHANGVFADLDISLPKFNAGSQYTFGIYIDPTEDIIIGRLKMLDAGNSSAPWEDGSNETVRRMGINLPSTISFQTDKATDAFADTELKISFDGVAPELGYKRIHPHLSDERP
mgnify:CR=1 FL=1